jgi:pyruvate/2-oxoglutarate dehydrogenase complex dihydrolipoamide acyltransferase (E2) component
MRKFILVSILVLASAAAQADQSHGLVLAANDEQIQSIQPDPPKADPQPEASKPVADAPKPATEASTPAKEDAKPVRKASRPVHRSRERGYASAEARARAIAARYGVSW